MLCCGDPDAARQAGRHGPRHDIFHRRPRHCQRPARPHGAIDSMPRILIADDHPLFRLALSQAVRELVPGANVAEAESLEETRTDLGTHPDTDLLLLDLHMPGSHGLMG